MILLSLHSDITTRLALISDTPDLDASVLIAHVINKPRTYVMAHPELSLSTEQQKYLNESVLRLEKGEPFPYVLGHWEFFGLDFDVTPDVLIPRPETELLIEKAIVWLQQNPTRKNIADVGTGSGAIAVSLAINIPDADILATDISSKALQVAKRNAKKHAVSKRIEFIECDLFPANSPISNPQSRFDLICANLPYIPTKTLSSLRVFGREPTVALDGGADGLDLIRRLLDIAPDWLAPNALILLELEATLGVQVLNLAYDMFNQEEIHLHQDLTGRDRLLEIRL
ncbi:MAG: peptide chain release factor N(5)-glutamine methyltransferase [Chloroflexota bacterium]